MAKRIIINLDAPGTRINRHIYGHFAEHLGTCIYGGIWVGEESPIPNLRGIRLDVLEALKKLRIPNLRWPGGCFADEYHWMDGIGPRENRPTMINTHWGGVTENNHFGTHEFLEFCELLGCEPFITGNVGSGTVQEMSQWVEYLNFDGVSPMTELRKKNGREKPWNVKFWGVGNENWGCGGNMRAEHYADQVRRYATYCRTYPGRKLYKIACGPSVNDYAWTETLMKLLVEDPKGLPPDRHVHAISLHHYSFTGTWEKKGRATRFSGDEWYELMARSWYMDELITRHSTIMDRYDPEKRIGLIVDEWGTWHRVEEDTNPGFLFQQNSLRDALVAAIHFGIFHAHADRVRMANIAQTVNVLQAMILTDGAKMVLTPTYHVFEMNAAHMDAELLPTFSLPDDSGQDEGLIADARRIPYVQATVSRNEGGRRLASLVNIDLDRSREVLLELRGGKASDVKGRILTAAEPNAHNMMDAPTDVAPVAFTDFKVEEGGIRVTLPAHSFVTLEF